MDRTNEKEGFINIPRNFFQLNENYNSATIFSEAHGIRNKHKYTGATEENLLSVYSILMMMKNKFDYSVVSLSFIADCLGVSRQNNNYKTIRNCLKVLNEVESIDLIDCDFDIDKVKPTDFVEVRVRFIDNYFMTVNESEMKLLDKLGSKFFTVYLGLKNFYIRDKHYSGIGIQYLSSTLGMSTRTVTKYIRQAYALDIINIEGGVYKWNEWVGKSTRTPHRYHFKPKRVQEVAEMSKMEIQEILNSVDGKEKKELKMMTRWLAEGDRSVSDEHVELVSREYQGLSDGQKMEVQEIYEKQIQHGSSDDYMKTAYLYSYYKVKVKNLGKNKLQNIIIKGDKVS